MAAARMALHSAISSRNVEAPSARLSLAPMRVYTPSITVISAATAGTNEPTCAITAMSATYQKGHSEQALQPRSNSLA